MHKPQEPDQLKPIVILLACLAAVAVMFFGSILAAYFAVQAERNAPSGQQIDQ
jgi:heme/copper-type cytochrome/quinol oxidase subunit 3